MPGRDDLLEYGRAARMRSCAFRIFEAETISIALVIFFVLSTLLILPRISLPAAIVGPCIAARRRAASRRRAPPRGRHSK